MFQNNRFSCFCLAKYFIEKSEILKVSQMLSSSFSVWCHEYNSLQTLKVFCSCCSSTSLIEVWVLNTFKWHSPEMVTVELHKCLGVSKHLLRMKLCLISSLTNRHFNKYQHSRIRQRWLFFLLKIIIWTFSYFCKTVFFHSQKDILNQLYTFSGILG